MEHRWNCSSFTPPRRSAQRQGALPNNALHLTHIAAAEVGYQAATFLGRGLDEEERQEWGAALDLGERARREIRGHELDHYVSRLERVRARTMAELGRRTDHGLKSGHHLPA